MTFDEQLLADKFYTQMFDEWMEGQFGDKRMKIAYRPLAIDVAPGDEKEDFIVENRAGFKLRATRSRCLRLGFTEDEISCAVTHSYEDNCFISCPRQGDSKNKHNAVYVPEETP